MDIDLIKTIAENTSVILVLLYWIWSERKSHQDDLAYYRDLIKNRLDEIEDKLASFKENK